MQYYCQKIPGLKEHALLDAEESYHLMHVKKGFKNQEIKLFDGKGTKAIGSLLKSSKKAATLEITHKSFSEEKETHVSLFFAPPKGKKLSVLLEKAVEVGVDSLYPLSTERGVRIFGEEKTTKFDKVLLAASKQAERSWLPKIYSMQPIQDAIAEKTIKTDINLFCHTTKSGNWLDPLKNLHEISKINIFVGPEGGWDEAEIEIALSHDFCVWGLPLPVMRVETAAIASVSIVNSVLSLPRKEGITH